VKRSIPLLLIPFLLLPAMGPAQQKKKKKGATDEGLYPPVILEDKKKKPEVTQTLPPPRELPTAVLGATDRIIFQVSPLSGKGLLSQQTRDALHFLQHSANGATILKLRAFVAGSGDMRRIGEIIGELWADRHTPLPALSVIQTGALPLEGAQVIIESIAEVHKAVNPNGVAFLAGQPGESLDQSLGKLQGTLKQAGMDDSAMLHVTCFVRSLDESRDAQRMMTQRFPNASVNYVQMQREYVLPVAECEGIARAADAAFSGVKFMLPAAPGYSQVVIVNGPKLVFSATQLAFGTQEGDVRLAFERLRKSITPLNARLETVAMSHFYLISRGLTDMLRTVRSEFYNKASPPASTMLPIEGLPSLDASLGVDVVAVADYTKTVSAEARRLAER
jgi:enamine deaminase RidA (YjgF/YER057c/UK114 family)